MGHYDCIILHNAANLAQIEGSEEFIYPSTVVREEVRAIEEALREGGLSTYILSVDQFSKDLITSISGSSPHFVFNLCEEINGRCELEMCVAGLLELMGVAYTGSGPFALGLALNKFHLKQLLRSSGIPAARGYVCYPGSKSSERRLRFPVIVKPVCQDASLGINSKSVCHDELRLAEQIAYIHKIYKQGALVEEYLDGREFNVSIMGKDEPEVLAISEIDFTCMPAGEPRIVSYRAKWDEESPLYLSTTPICSQLSVRGVPRLCAGGYEDGRARQRLCAGGKPEPRYFTQSRVCPSCPRGGIHLCADDI
jgi:D-alanine-D-alanine ligase